MSEVSKPWWRDQDPHAESSFEPSRITRPDDSLLRYYLVVSLFAFVAFPVVFLVHYIRFRTLRYRFDDEGVWMGWGWLWRQEISLTYRRIQDIHVTKNVLQRWFGLASVQLQTAAGGVSPQMVIEGVLDAEKLRDFLYTKMRGARGEVVSSRGESPTQSRTDTGDQVLRVLEDIRAGVERQNARIAALEARARGGDNGSS
ncbi:MAG: PH domain-containing protein [Phycisphaerales bacterium]|nr:PH domain-containing protein [Phycisphaerales bacterium]